MIERFYDPVNHQRMIDWVDSKTDEVVRKLSNKGVKAVLIQKVRSAGHATWTFLLTRTDALKEAYIIETNGVEVRWQFQGVTQ